MKTRMVAFLLVLVCCASLPSIAVTPCCVRVAESVTRNMRVTKVDPKYPPEAQQARVQGMVRLQVRTHRS